MFFFLLLSRIFFVLGKDCTFEERIQKLKRGRGCRILRRSVSLRLFLRRTPFTLPPRSFPAIHNVGLACFGGTRRGHGQGRRRHRDAHAASRPEHQFRWKEVLSTQVYTLLPPPSPNFPPPCYPFSPVLPQTFIEHADIVVTGAAVRSKNRLTSAKGPRITSGSGEMLLL